MLFLSARIDERVCVCADALACDQFNRDMADAQKKIASMRDDMSKSLKYDEQLNVLEYHYMTESAQQVLLFVLCFSCLLCCYQH